MSGFKLSLAASVAIHALALLSKESSKTHSTEALAERLGVSPAHLAKVLQRLAHCGLVQMVRGAHGGARSAVPAGELSIYQVYEAIDGPIGSYQCQLRSGLSKRSCALAGVVTAANKAVRAELEKAMVADVELCKG